MGVNFDKQSGQRILAATRWVEQQTRTALPLVRKRRQNRDLGGEQQQTVWYGKLVAAVDPGDKDGQVTVWSGEPGQAIQATTEVLTDCHWEIPADGPISADKWVEVVLHDGVYRIFPLECE